MGQTIRGTNPTKRLPGFRPFGPREPPLEFPERLALGAQGVRLTSGKPGAVHSQSPRGERCTGDTTQLDWRCRCLPQDHVAFVELVDERERQTLSFRRVDPLLH